MRLPIFGLLLCPFLLAAGVEVRNDIEFSRVAGEVLTMDAHIPQGPGPFAEQAIRYVKTHAGEFRIESEPARADG